MYKGISNLLNMKTAIISSLFLLFSCQFIQAQVQSNFEERRSIEAKEMPTAIKTQFMQMSSLDNIVSLSEVIKADGRVFYEIEKKSETIVLDGSGEVKVIQKVVDQKVIIEDEPLIEEVEEAVETVE